MAYEPPAGPGGPAEPPFPEGAVPEAAILDSAGPAWWEDRRGWDEGDGWEPFPRRRRSRVVQWTGVVVAAALVLGSVGTTVEVVFGRHPAVLLPTADVGLSAAAASSSGTGRTTPGVRVTFEVANPTGASAAPVCRVSVVRGTRRLGLVAGARARALPPGGAALRTVLVPLALPLHAGARARAACWS